MVPIEALHTLELQHTIGNTKQYRHVKLNLCFELCVVPKRTAFTWFLFKLHKGSRLGHESPMNECFDTRGGCLPLKKTFSWGNSSVFNFVTIHINMSAPHKLQGP